MSHEDALVFLFLRYPDADNGFQGDPDDQAGHKDPGEDHADTGELCNQCGISIGKRYCQQSPDTHNTVY